MVILWLNFLLSVAMANLCTFQSGVEYEYNNVVSLSVHSVDECCEACFRSNDCVVFTFITGKEGKNNTCDLKNQESKYPTDNADAISGWNYKRDSEEYTDQLTHEIHTLIGEKLEIYLWGSDFYQLLQLPTVKSITTWVKSLPDFGHLAQFDDKSLKANDAVNDILHRIVYVAPKKMVGDSTSMVTSFEVYSKIAYDGGEEDTITLLVNVHINEVGEFECESADPIEIGEVGNLVISSDFIEVAFKKKYKNPVVLAQPLSYDNDLVSIGRLVANSTHFRIGIHHAETSWKGKSEKVSYIVIEAGSWVLASGKRLEVGKAVTSATVGIGMLDSTWTTISYPANGLFQQPPVVFTQVQSMNDPHWVTTRQKFGTVSNFMVSLEEEEANQEAHGGEIVGWLAMEAGTGEWSPDTSYQVGTYANLGQIWRKIEFHATDPTVHFMASILTYNTNEPTHIRYQRLTNNSVEVKLEEDEWADPKAIEEEIGWIAIQGSGPLLATPADCNNGKPIAYNYEGEVEIGEVILITLKEKSQKKLNARILSLPKHGTLHQYEHSEPGDSFIAPGLVKDNKGRVLYIADDAELDTTSGTVSDIITYVLEDDDLRSNVGEVTLEITPVGHQGETPKPDKPKKNKDKDPYKSKFTIAVVILGVLLVIASLLLAFLYKKSHTLREVFDEIKASITAPRPNYDYISVNNDLTEDESVESPNLESSS